MLSVLVLALIGVHTFELDEFRRLIDRLNPLLVLPALAMVGVRVFFGGWRLSYVSHGNLSIGQGIRAQLAWDFFSNVSPSAIGGGPFAALYVARDRRIKVGEATAFMLFAILLDQLFFAVTIPLLLLGMPFLEVFPDSLGRVGTLALTGLFIGMMVWVTVFGYAVLVRPELLQRMIDGLFKIKWLRKFRSRVAGEMVQFARYSTFLRSQPLRFFVNGFLLTTASWTGRYLLTFFIVWSVYPSFDWLLLIVRTAAMSVGSMFLPTPGGSGGIEWLYFVFIGPLIPGALVAPTLLVWRLLGYYLFLGLGVFLSMHHVQQTIRHRRREHRRALRNGNGVPEVDEEYAPLP